MGMRLHHIVVITLVVIKDVLLVQTTTKVWEDAKPRLVGYGYSKTAKSLLGKSALESSTPNSNGCTMVRFRREFLIKKNIMKTIIILGKVGHVDRRFLDGIEGNVYENYNDFESNVKLDDAASIYSISDFMDEFNDGMDDLSEYWIGYVYFK
jgi:hypothetical protein